MGFTITRTKLHGSVQDSCLNRASLMFEVFKLPQGVHPTRSQGKGSEFMERISNSPQEGTFHEEPLKLLYDENQHCFFCPNLWLVVWNKPSSTHRCFFCVQILARKEKKRGHANALKGEKKGSRDKDAIAKFTRAVDVGWQPTLHVPIGWSEDGGSKSCTPNTGVCTHSS